jgi:gas vesicle protein
MKDRDSDISFMWFSAGLGLGAILGVLYAPRSGRETRETIMESAQQGREYVRSRGREARESVTQWVEDGKDLINQQKEQFASAVDAGREAYREATGEDKTRLAPEELRT